MKKFLLVLLILLTSGCKKNLICIMNSSEENYEAETKVVFEFKSNKIINAYSIYTMTFDTKAETESYLSILDTLDKDYSVSQKTEKQLEIKTFKDYEVYNNNSMSIIEEFEKEGYSCK